jgi:hypothetical protein
LNDNTSNNTTANELPSNDIAKKALITLVAVIGYGSWALYSNWPADSDAHGQMIAIRAACIQGFYSGFLTLITVIALEAIFLRLNKKLSCRSNMIVTVAITAIMQYSIIVPVHIFNQTPNILITLLPGFIIGTIFSTVFLMSVKAKHYPAS